MIRTDQGQTHGLALTMKKAMKAQQAAASQEGCEARLCKMAIRMASHRPRSQDPPGREQRIDAEGGAEEEGEAIGFS